MAANIDIIQKAGAPLSQRYLKVFIREVFEKTGIPVNREDVSLSVIIVGNQRIKTINKRHRNKDKVTDVISIGQLKKTKNNDVVDELWGDIFICYPQAQEAARYYGHSIKDEFKVLLVHGILHLIGFDHMNRNDMSKMQKLEKKLLGKGLIGR